MLSKTALAAWLLLGAVPPVSGECVGEACAEAADEAGLLQLKSPGDLGFLELATPQPAEAPTKVFEEVGGMKDPNNMPSDARLSMLGLAKAAGKSSRKEGSAACKFNEAGDCPLSSLPKSGSSTIQPSHKWGCECINSSVPFAFQVFPGRYDKLLMYFQDGGACWDMVSASVKACKQEIFLQDEVGVFDKSDDSNPFKDYTVVHVNYCSGDAFSGNSIMPWGRIAGYNNARAAMTWALNNMDKKLKNLAIMGASAGALAVQVWSRTLLQKFSEGHRSYKSAMTVVDSYMGLFPENTQPYILGKIFKACSTPLGKGWTLGKCGKDLTVQDVMVESMGMFPDVPFLFINSKADTVQIEFYAAVSFTLKGKLKMLTPDQVYTKASEVLDRYSASPNFAAFQVDGEKHMFLPEARCDSENTKECFGDMYDAVPAGPLAGMNTNSKDSLLSWLEHGRDHKHLICLCKGKAASLVKGKPFHVSECLTDLEGKELVLR